jgi:hypothetical protein
MKIAQCFIGFVIAICLFSNASCQTTTKKTDNAKTPETSNDLKATTTVVYNDDAAKGQYLAAIKVEKGKLKVGESIDAIGEGGVRFTFLIKDIKVNDQTVKEATANASAFVSLQAIGKAIGFDQGFTIVNKGASATPNIPNAVSTELTCTISGREWKAKAFAHSCSFFAKGVQKMYNGEPYLGLAFTAIAKPDGRQINFAIKNFAGKIGKIQDKDLEVLISGSADGDTKRGEMQGFKMNTQNINFNVEITAYKNITATEAIISGRFSGTLKGLLLSKDIQIENGVFTNVKLEVFNDKANF